MTIFSELNNNSQKIFNQGLALSLLAISLPFSSFIIISIYVSNNFFATPNHLIAASMVAFMSAFLLLKQKVQNREEFYASVRERMLVTTIENTRQSAKSLSREHVQSRK